MTGPQLHTLSSACLKVSLSKKYQQKWVIYQTWQKYIYICAVCENLPDRWVCVWSWAVSWKTVSKSSSAESSRRQSCTEEKNVEATSQMKEMSGSMLPASDRLLVSDRVVWSFSKIFSMYTSPIRGSAQVKTAHKDDYVVLWLIRKSTNYVYQKSFLDTDQNDSYWKNKWNVCVCIWDHHCCGAERGPGWWASNCGCL